MANLSLEALLEELRHQPDWLMVQDLDGVCMPLVLDPLTRVMPAPYIRAAARLQGRFCVLTNGEHAGLRGVNPLVERALAGTANPASERALPARIGRRGRAVARPLWPNHLSRHQRR